MTTRYTIQEFKRKFDGYHTIIKILWIKIHVCQPAVAGCLRSIIEGQVRTVLLQIKPLKNRTHNSIFNE